MQQTIDNLTIGEAKQLASMFTNKPDAPGLSGHPSGQHIVVIDRGFVYAGEVTCNHSYVVIKNAKNVRVWGTTKGLGELRNGPLSGTKTDAVGEVIVPHKAVIHFIPCKGF